MTDKDPIRYEVLVINAFKSYGENNVLNGLNMKVQSGGIYGLLGPSGCGKSTLLQCILGTVTLDSGCIDFNMSLHDVGYMPQDLCLEELMTVRETFEYYGTLHNMSMKRTTNRIKELNKFLQLPSLNSYINEISGGQSRRVSLAISLLHNPKVIILDEPTVGTDPLLRQNIWTEFTKMARQQNITIIITTHYIEEANQADRIGLMRNGVLVEEGSPQDILTKYGTDTLEDTFLTLCCKQTNNRIVEKKTQVKVSTRLKNVTKIKSSIKLYRIKALLKKNIHVCSRDYMLLFTILFLPILQTFNFCFGIGVNFKYMPISVKNDEINVFDCKNYNVKGCIFNGKDDQKMSCVVLRYLESRDYRLIEVKDQKVGEMSMKKPNNMAFLYFPKNYTKNLATFIYDREHYKSETRVYVHSTKENFLFRNQITKDIVESIKHVIEETLKSCSDHPNSVGIPLNFITLFGHDVKTFANGFISIFIAILAFYYPSVYAASIMTSEKMDGTLGRAIISGVNVLELLISMFVFSTVINVLQMTVACFVTFVLYSNPIQITTGLFIYTFLVLLLGWIGFFFGILAAVLSPTKLACIYIITGTSLTQFLLSGSVWPLEGQPKVLRIISEILPIRMAGNTMNNIALKGWTWDHSSIIMGTSVTFTYTMLLVFVLIVLGKFKKDMWIIHK